MLGVAIKIIDLPRGMDKVAGWWYKPYIFSKDLSGNSIADDCNFNFISVHC